jgi:hypothetical protein
MKKSFVILGAALFAVSGCSGTIARMKSDHDRLEYSEFAGEPIDSFTAFDIDSWEPVSRNQLVVWTGVNDAYLLTVWKSCHDLMFTDRVAVNRTGNSVTRLDSVVVRGERCPIEDIRAVDIKRMKETRAALRAKPQ